MHSQYHIHTIRRVIRNTRDALPLSPDTLEVSRNHLYIWRRLDCAAVVHVALVRSLRLDFPWLLSRVRLVSSTFSYLLTTPPSNVILFEL